MTLRNLSFALAAAIGLLGCAGGGMKLASPCNGGNCSVLVTITNCAAPNGVSVVPERFAVSGSNNIVWDIATPGYSFTKQGIVLKDYYGQFGNLQLNPTGKKITVHNGNTHQVPVPYMVNVMRDDGTPCIPLDPWIINE